MLLKRIFEIAITTAVLPISALAADYPDKPAYGVQRYCPPPGTPKVYHQRWLGSDQRTPLFVAPHNAGGGQMQIYVEPQQAYIVSDACPNQYRMNWYEGKLWYYNAGSPQGPDTFRIIKLY